MLLRKKRKNESWFVYIMSVLHLWLGLLSSIVIVVVCFTGSLYTFKQQLEDLVNREYLVVHGIHSTRLPIDSIIGKFENKFGKATQIYLFKEADRSVLISSTSKDNPGVSAYFNPFNGELIGIKSIRSEEFFIVVLEIHRFLLAGDMGKLIVGIAVLVLVFMLSSGFVLWIPKRMKQFKQRFIIKWRARFYRLNYDMHNVLGFYALFLLLFIAITGLYVSFHWMKNGILVGLGGESIVISDSNNALKNNLSQSFNALLGTLEIESHALPGEQDVSLQHVLSKADSILKYQGISHIVLPNDQVNTIQLTKLNDQNFFGFVAPDYIEFSSRGRIRRITTFQDLKLHEQFKAIAKPLHTGEIMGLPSLIVYFLISLIGSSLPITGFIIWWKKYNTL